jgi:hypothetical protein
MVVPLVFSAALSLLLGLYPNLIVRLAGLVRP